MHITLLAVAVLHACSRAVAMDMDIDVEEVYLKDLDAMRAEVVESKPTYEEWQRFYPEIAYNVEAVNSSITPSRLMARASNTYGYRFVAGGLTAVGYWALAGGSTQINNAIDACNSTSGGIGTLKCVNTAGAAVAAHVLVAGTGYAGGSQTIALIWNKAPEAAANVATGSKRSTCSASQTTWSNSHRFTSPQSLTLAGKNFCSTPSGTELGYAGSIASKIVDGMDSSSHYSVDSTFTLYRTSSEVVLGRFRMQFLDDGTTQACPTTISGGNSCTY